MITIPVGGKGTISRLYRTFGEVVGALEIG